MKKETALEYNQKKNQLRFFPNSHYSKSRDHIAVGGALWWNKKNKLHLPPGTIPTQKLPAACRGLKNSLWSEVSEKSANGGRLPMAT